MTRASDPVLAQTDIEHAFLHACALDVAVMKPGNVSHDSPGHGMEAAQFVASAAAAAPALCATGAPIGRRILDAVLATRSVVDCNTNLGILLLCAPIAAAGESLGAATGAGADASAAAGADAGAAAGADAGGASRDAGAARLRQLRGHVQQRLNALTVADARAAFKAIALASPGGLGTVDEQDVRGEATVDLRAAMRLAAERDAIARQYVNGFAEVFEVGVAAWLAAVDADYVDKDVDPVRMQHAYLAFLAHGPDSHLVRKHGDAVAREVAIEAAGWLARLLEDARATQAGLAKWDARLKRAGLNPGTSADLAVATAFAAEIAFSQCKRVHTAAG